MISYLLSVTVLWAISLLLYELGFRRLPMHRENRAYLLVSFATGLLLPLLSFSVNTSDTPPLLREPVLQSTQLRHQIVAQASGPDSSSGMVSWLWTGYATGAILAFLVIIYQAFSLAAVYRKGRKEKQSGYTVIYTEHQHAPFSFFSCIFLPASVGYNGAELAMIVRHEKEHARLLHSLDVLAVLSVRSLLWFHPLVHLYWNRLRIVHEYQADAVETSNASVYGQFLLEQNMLTRAPSFAHSIFHSPLKKRIAMLLKTTTATRLRYLTALILLPAIFLCCAYATPQGKRAKKGNTIYYNGNVIELSGLPADTTEVLNPVTGEMQFVVTSMDSFPVALNGRLIDRSTEYAVDPKFSGPGTNAALMMFGRLQRLLNQLEDGVYELRIDRVIIDATGKIAYYELDGIYPSSRKLSNAEIVGATLDSAPASQVDPATGIIIASVHDMYKIPPPPNAAGPRSIQSGLKKKIDAAAEQLLDNDIRFTPAVAADGTAVPAVVTEALWFPFSTLIGVSGHNAVLYTVK